MSGLLPIARRIGTSGVASNRAWRSTSLGKWQEDKQGTVFDGSKRTRNTIELLPGKTLV